MKLQRLQALLGHEFRDPLLAARALTHRSAGPRHNERLEFLGDGLLNFVIGEALYSAHPDLPEGDLTRLRASLVRMETLADLAARLKLGDDIVLGAGELRSGGHNRGSIQADTLEALIGAVYVDAGFDAARGVCLRLYQDALEHLPDPATLKDAKTRLQEWLQARGRPLPVYVVVETFGPAHRTQFSVSCRLPDGDEETQAMDTSRRAADQAAARLMLERLTTQPGAVQPHGATNA